VAKIREKEADYVLSVKENQPETHRDIREYFGLVEEDRGIIRLTMCGVVLVRSTTGGQGDARL